VGARDARGSLKPVTQLISAVDRPRGDCVRACIATILERNIEDVPHVVELEAVLGYYWLDLMNGWLRTERYPFQLVQRQFQATRENPIQLYYLRAPLYAASHKQQWSKWGFEFPGYYMMSVRSKAFKGAHHAVVARDDRIVWDPSPHFGEPAYDRKPYYFEGWITFFIATHLQERRS
jgi:hypothetical protein